MGFLFGQPKPNYYYNPYYHPYYAQNFPTQNFQHSIGAEAYPHPPEVNYNYQYPYSTQPSVNQDLYMIPYDQILFNQPYVWGDTHYNQSSFQAPFQPFIYREENDTPAMSEENTGTSY